MQQIVLYVQKTYEHTNSEYSLNHHLVLLQAKLTTWNELQTIQNNHLVHKKQHLEAKIKKIKPIMTSLRERSTPRDRHHDKSISQCLLVTRTKVVESSCLVNYDEAVASEDVSAGERERER